MNKSLALSILAIQEDQLDEIDDCIEELIFPIRNKIIQRPNLPRVIDVHLKRLYKVLEAYKFLSQNDFEIVQEDILVNLKGDYKNVFDNYNIQYAVLISQVMNAQDLSSLISKGEKLISFQNQWIQYNYEFSKSMIADYKKHLKITLAAIHDPVALVNGAEYFVNKLKSSETILKKYTFEQLDNNMQVLIKEWVRLNQYYEQYG